MTDDKRYRVRDRNWAKVWGDDLTLDQANKLKETVVGQQKSRTARVESMDVPDPRIGGLISDDVKSDPARRIKEEIAAIDGGDPDQISEILGIYQDPPPPRAQRRKLSSVPPGAHPRSYPGKTTKGNAQALANPSIEQLERRKEEELAALRPAPGGLDYGTDLTDVAQGDLDDLIDRANGQR